MDEAELALSWQYWSCVVGHVGSLYFFLSALHMFEILPGTI